MVQAPAKTNVLVEVYPVLVENLPPLTAWQLDAPQQDAAELGQKLAHRLRLRLGSHWIWAQERLVTDSAAIRSDLVSFLENLWANDDEAFKKIASLEQDVHLQPNVQTIADFVAFGVTADLDKPIRELLRRHRTTIRNAMIERDYEVQGWAVGGKPAISITVFSHVYAAQPLPKFIQEQIHSLDDLMGLLVKDRTSTMRGEIERVVGTVGELRENLIKRSSRNIMKQAIADALENDLVLRVRTRKQQVYDYPASTLTLVASTAQYGVLGIDGQEALAALQIQPAPRYQMVNQIVKQFADLGYIASQPYNAVVTASHFRLDLDAKLGIRAKLGDGATCECTPQAVLNALRKYPVYRRSIQIPPNQLMRLAVLNLIGNKSSIQEYLADIRKGLAEVGFNVHFTGAQRPNHSRHAVEVAVEQLLQEQPHLVIGLAPGDPGDGESDSDLYLMLKGVMVGRDVQSQLIYERTLGNEYALNNLLLGILAKTGNIPYVLDKPLPYTDLVVGIDIARERNVRGRGSLNVAAMTRIYAANGDFLKYYLTDTPVQGETLTRNDIHRLFPSTEFAGKRCVVHRDGLFRGDEIRHLIAWGTEIGATFYPVEVVKSRVPRLYKMAYDQVSRPDKGMAFVLNDREAFLVSSLPPSRNSTPRPLLVRTKGGLSIDDALHSVLALTHLHFGSVPMPRLPVTLHYSDQIGYLFLRGVRPKTNEGTNPFWI